MFTYNDPLIIAWRAGTEEDPFSDRVNESYKILNGTILLQEVPDEFTRVLIQDYVEVFDTSKESVSPSKFIVNYQNGIVTFDSSQEGKTVIVKSYKGRGILLYPAERIYTKDGEGIVITIQDIIDNGQTAIDANNQLSQTIAEANAAIANANTATANANQAAGSVGEAIENAEIATEGAIVATTAANTAAQNLEYKGEWGDFTLYKKGNCVRSGNKMYICINDTIDGISLENELYWKLSFDASSVISTAITVTEEANLAKENAITATTNANNAATAANESKANADVATANAIEATDSANTAKVNADEATSNANNAATAANIAATEANEIVVNFVSKGAWSNTVVYAAKNIVLYNGSTYQSLADSNVGNQPDISLSQWQLVAIKGADGLGTVQGISAASENIIVGGTVQNPTIEVNAGTSANQLLKLDANGMITANGGMNICSGLFSIDMNQGVSTNNGVILDDGGGTSFLPNVFTSTLTNTWSLTLNPMYQVTSTNTTSNSARLNFEGAYWGGANSKVLRMTMQANSSGTLSFSNHGDAEILSIDQNGIITSFVPDGIAPFVIASKTMVSNLNSERVNGVKITVGKTAPSNPQPNDIWIDTN